MEFIVEAFSDVTSWMRLVSHGVYRAAGRVGDH